MRPKVHEFLRSEEGRKKQSEISKKAWESRKKNLIKCIECGKEKLTTQPWTKFCGCNCEKKYRRKQGIDNIEVKCQMCDKLYFKDKYSPKIFCSISCGAKNTSKNKLRSTGRFT